MRLLVFSASLFALVLAGCGGEPRFDATSEVTVKASMERMMARMSDQEKQEFGEDIMAVAATNVMKEAFGAAFSGKKADASTSHMFAPLHGLTAAEIRLKATALKAGREARPKEARPGR